MKARDLRELGAEEMAQRIRETSQEIARLKLKSKSGDAADKPVRMRLMRRDIARMHTVLAEREAK